MRLRNLMLLGLSALAWSLAPAVYAQESGDEGAGGESVAEETGGGESGDWKEGF